MTLRSIGALKICAFMPAMFYIARQLASGARIDELALKHSNFSNRQRETSFITLIAAYTMAKTMPLI